jgi:ADP-ribosyl-[dinitrogen reductase] hydrolase
MLFEVAIADAYGCGFEFCPPDAQRRNTLEGYVPNTAYTALQPGRYSDDTQMSLAVAETLLGGDVTPYGFASSFVRAYQRDPRPGYGKAFHAFLKTVSDVDDFLARINPQSERSGAAMRAGPVGLLGQVDEVLEVARVQARVTHDTVVGVGAAQAAALMVHHQLHGLGPLSDLYGFLDRHVPSIDWRQSLDPTDKRGDAIVRMALHALVGAQSRADLLLRAVGLGGDTDTVAAIAMAAGSQSTELAHDIPLALVEGLENATYGRDHLRAVDVQLYAYARDRM